jgi:F-type H+-transporting ATPase subunit epsilon
MPEYEGRLRCVVVTPERAVLDERADFVVLPMYDGELGVLPQRAPLIGRLGFGELRLKQGERVQRYFVDGGFAQVRADVVTVLTPRAMKAEEIDVEKTRRNLEDLLAPSEGGDSQDQKLKAQSRARVMLRVAGRARA